MKKSAFTMIELVFVIVVLGILAAVAVPRLAATRDDAQIVTGRADVAAIRSGIINERQTRLFRGDPSFIGDLDSGGLFGGVMTYAVTAGAAGQRGHWTGASPTYKYETSLGAATFDYNSTTGIFDCTGGAGTACAALTD